MVQVKVEDELSASAHSKMVATSWVDGTRRLVAKGVKCTTRLAVKTLVIIRLWSKIWHWETSILLGRKLTRFAYIRAMWWVWDSQVKSSTLISLLQTKWMCWKLNSRNQWRPCKHCPSVKRQAVMPFARCSICIKQKLLRDLAIRWHSLKAVFPAQLVNRTGAYCECPHWTSNFLNLYEVWPKMSINWHSAKARSLSEGIYKAKKK